MIAGVTVSTKRSRASLGNFSRRASHPVWESLLIVTVQGEAIAFNLREMFGIRVPIIATVIGEGGSGGALAIGCGNKMLMLENAVYYVAR